MKSHQPVIENKNFICNGIKDLYNNLITINRIINR